jgi:hypothetical protein
VLALDEIDPPFDVEGHSHIPIFFVESLDFVPGKQPVGSYELTVTLRDASGNGWDATADFQVIPEPGTALAGVALAVLAAIRLRRR